MIYFRDNQGSLRKLNDGGNLSLTLEFLKLKSVKKEIQYDTGITPESAVMAVVK